MESSNDNSKEWACTIRDIYGRVQHAVFTLLVISYLVSNPDKIAQGNNYIFVVMDSAGNFAKLTVRKTLTAIAKTLAPGNHPLVGAWFECRGLQTALDTKKELPTSPFTKNILIADQTSTFLRLGDLPLPVPDLITESLKTAMDTRVVETHTNKRYDRHLDVWVASKPHEFQSQGEDAYKFSIDMEDIQTQITIFSSLGGLHCPKIVELLDQGFQLLIRATNLQRDFSPTYGDNLKSTNKTTLHILDKKQNKRAKTEEGRIIVEKQHGNLTLIRADNVKTCKECHTTDLQQSGPTTFKCEDHGFKIQEMTSFTATFKEDIKKVATEDIRVEPFKIAIKDWKAIDFPHVIIGVATVVALPGWWKYTLTAFEHDTAEDSSEGVMTPAGKGPTRAKNSQVLYEDDED